MIRVGSAPPIAIDGMMNGSIRHHPSPVVVAIDRSIDRSIARMAVRRMRAFVRSFVRVGRSRDAGRIRPVGRVGRGRGVEGRLSVVC
jgi:hypothetical protein